MVQVKIFQHYDIVTLQLRINTWIVEDKIGVADVKDILQTESGSGPRDDGGITISIWYIKHLKDGE